jgi:cytochrome c peroxidase
VQRDIDPKAWYPADKFDDLPPAFRPNVDIVDEPLTRAEGGTPAWNDSEIDDVIAFLGTLTDEDTHRVLKQ